MALLNDRDMPCKEALEYLADIGISERTVNKAKKKLGIKSVRVNGMWHWTLPESGFNATETEAECDGED